MVNTMYDTSLIDVNLAASAGLGALIAGFSFIYFFVAFLLFALAIAGRWIIFKKAGKPGWSSIIPIYSSVVEYQIVGLSPWLLLLFIVPIANFIAIPVLTAVAAFKLAKVFGKDIAWGFGLWLLPSIFNLILAFGDSKYVGLKKDSTEGETKKEE